MSVQVELNNSNVPFILSGNAYSRGDQVISQDAGRVAILTSFTVMGKIAATQKWEPLISLAAVDGTALAQGIYIGPDIAAADLVAGDIADASILVGGGFSVDTDQLVLENSLTLDDVMGAATIDARTVRDQLAYRGIFAEDTVAISSFENP